MDAVELIRQKAAEARMAAKAKFLLMADAIAKGDGPPADALEVMAAAGLDADQLEKAVAIARERLSLEPRADALERVLADRVKAEGELAAAVEKADAELKAAYAKVDAVLAPLRQKVDGLKTAEVDGRYAKARLREIAAQLARALAPAGPITSDAGDRRRSAVRGVEIEVEG